MALQSMTGFSREAGIFQGHQWAWELKSVNARGLDVRVRVPTGFDAVGDEARRQVGAAFARGTINVSLNLTSENVVAHPRVNADALRSLLDSLAKIDFSAVSLPAESRGFTLDGLLGIRGVIEVNENAGPALDDLQPVLVAALDRAIAGLKAARLAEGRSLAAVLEQHAEAITILTSSVENHPARTPEAIRARLAEQVTALLATPAGLDGERLHQEAAMLAVRADVREEIDRLKAHGSALVALLSGGGAIGRKLDFLAQEFGREASTLCAKANHVTLSRIGLDLRTVVDQLREQVQNVE
jgi:uncharacterized protein (TIGR00255 family)